MLAGSLALPFLCAAPAHAQALLERPPAARPGTGPTQPPTDRNIVIDYIEPIHPSFLDVDKDDPRYAELRRTTGS